MNTSVFHARVSYRKRRYHMKGLKDDSGRWVSDLSQMRQMVCSFYKELFTSQSETRDASEFIGRKTILSDETIAKLTRDFSEAEVELALEQMGSDKALGQDGLNARFYKTH
ncbi:hypothetical protein Droror1_Dr00003982 [Drosera rotundifolia]